MNDAQIRLMRDVFIEGIYQRMYENNKIFFLSDDFGSVALDKIRKKFKERFINVGIAEQNLINISTGLALEGFTVYAYAIAPFLTMRSYEQIKVNLSLLSHIKEININLVGVGGGVSYDLSGATHHCLEDISIMRVLPNLVIFSPSDWWLTKRFVDFSLQVKKPKYLRLDGKPLAQIYSSEQAINLEDGFYKLIKGEKVCLISTGFMTHTAMDAARNLLLDNIRIGVIDVFLLKPINPDLIFEAIKEYGCIITLEEGFIGKGGLDTAIANILNSRDKKARLVHVGFSDQYVLKIGQRSYLHQQYGLDKESLIKTIRSLF